MGRDVLSALRSAKAKAVREGVYGAFEERPLVDAALWAASHPKTPILIRSPKVLLMLARALERLKALLRSLALRLQLSRKGRPRALPAEAIQATVDRLARTAERIRAWCPRFSEWAASPEFLRYAIIMAYANGARF
ncbi:MAG: hypothetical protein QXG32_00725 [Candidatus Bathyarchaeia archaeon]